MFQSYKLLKCGQLLRGRPIYSKYKLYEPLSSINLQTSYLQPRISMSTASQPPPKPDKSKEEFNDLKKGAMDYIVEFKTNNVGKIFKEFYSLYGPVFVACHIGVSLVSLGFFCSIVWLTIDPTSYLPDSITSALGRVAMDMTGEGSKFILAYAAHKLILPIRLGAAIALTRSVSKKIKFKKQMDGKKID